MNVTVNGWSRLIAHYGTQMRALTLQECDLDDAQLAIVVGGFVRLQYLDVSSNRINEATALRSLCPGLRVLKVGPRLIGSNVSADIPILPIVEGRGGRELRELHLQGFLSPKLARVAEMEHLERLSIRFMKPLFEDAALSGSVFAAIGRLSRLKCLEIYQVCFLNF